jgi:predicted RNase H-like HicB family nuclease
MLSAYIRAAMARATYKKLDGSDRYFFEIPRLQGAWADADTVDAGRAELQEVLENWIALGLSMHQELPVLDGIDINMKHATSVGH